jgi:transposase
MPKIVKINKENASYEELMTAMRASPTKEGFIVFQGVDFLYQGKSIQETAQLLHVTERTVRNWVSKYNKGGISALAYRGKSGRPRKIPIAKFQAQYIPLILDSKRVGIDNFTAIKFHSYLTKEHNEELCYQTLLNYFHENDLSLVVPRPQVIDKQDTEKRAEFIAKITELLRAKAELWFCDEVGFEGDPRPRARWVKRGSTPVNGRASEHIRFSAIGAINPISGESFNLVVPQVDTLVFQVYLNELHATTNGRNITLVLDNASWHKTASINWHNITPLYLPPYSPDFNPIENLWRFIKINHFSNWYAKNVEELIEKICVAFNSLTKDQIIQTTNPKYLVQ